MSFIENYSKKISFRRNLILKCRLSFKRKFSTFFTEWPEKSCPFINFHTDFLHNKNFFTKSDVLQSCLPWSWEQLCRPSHFMKKFLLWKKSLWTRSQKIAKSHFFAHSVYICNKVLYLLNKLFILYLTTLNVQCVSRWFRER